MAESGGTSSVCAGNVLEGPIVKRCWGRLLFDLKLTSSRLFLNLYYPHNALTHVSCRFSHCKRLSLAQSSSPFSNKHFLGPWSNNSGNNIQRSAVTGIVSALFINEVICQVLLTAGRENTLTGSNGIWPNGNDILTAAICKVRAPKSCPGGCVTPPPRANTMKRV